MRGADVHPAASGRGPGLRPSGGLVRDAALVLGGTGLPAVVVQEGGYHLPTLGGLVGAYLHGHAGSLTGSLSR